jgi:hypothetical protein
MFRDPAREMGPNAQRYGRILLEQFSPAVVGLAVLGGVAVFVRQWRVGVLLALAWLAQFIFVINYARYDVQVFYIPGYAVIALAASLGLGAILDSVTRVTQRLSYGRPWMVGALGGALALVARRVTFLDATEFAGYPYPSQSPGSPHASAAKLVNALEDNAIVFTGWDLLYACYFVAHVEQGRTDLAFHETYPQDGMTQLAESTVAYIEANLDTRPIYFTERPQRLPTRYAVVRVSTGLFRLERK